MRSSSSNNENKHDAVFSAKREAGPFERAAHAAMAALLAFTLCPCAALADNGSSDGSRSDDALSDLDLQSEEALRIEEVDSQKGSYEEGEILVVYRDDSSALRQAASDNPLPTVPGARAELIGDSEDFGKDECSMLAIARASVPENMTVGEAIVAAEQDPQVDYAQPNYRYQLLQDRYAAPSAHTIGALPVQVGEGSAGQSDDDAEGLAPAGASVQSGIEVDDPYAQVTANVKSVPNQWWLHEVKAPQAWALAKCEHDVTVAVLDTGINFGHEDLQANILADYAWDATKAGVNGIGAPLTESPRTSLMSHGSHVAGIAAAEANNGKGIAGASYNANILPINVFTVSGGRAGCDDADLVKAYRYLLSDPNPADGEGLTVAQRTNTRVVNMSLGGYGRLGGYDLVFEEWIREAEEQGVLTVAAGGNGDDFGNPRTDPSYPSDYDEVMSVVALESPTQRVSWSDYNGNKNIAAPGVDIWSTWWTGNQYEHESGTSMASPLVAGCAALLWAYDPGLTVQQAKDAVYATAIDLGQPGKDDYYGYGKLDIAAAIQSLGRAHITAQRQAMGRTGTQQLAAYEVADPSAAHEWSWSVSDPALASITRDGMLTAIAPGTVAVHVEDSVDPELSGSISIVITDIQVPEDIVATSDSVNHRVTVRWKAADAAVEYRVLRAKSSAGPYEQIASVPSAAELQESASHYEYVDDTAALRTNYYYKVQPIGALSGAPVEGALSNAARGYLTDKAALAASIAQATELLGSATVSGDGSDVPPDGQWTTQSEYDNLQASVSRAQTIFASMDVRQETVNAANSELNSSMERFRASLAAGLERIELDESDVSVESAVFAGFAVTPPVTVVHGGIELVQGEDYELSWESNDAPGRGTVKVTGMGRYKGTVSKDFVISASEPAPTPGADAGSGSQPSPVPAETQLMHRLYNPNSGEHFYTVDTAERNNLVKLGWRYEGLGWTAPSSGAPVYRLYNPNAGDHHYTTSDLERDSLTKAGWRYEGRGWFSDPDQSVPLYRLYNPHAKAGAHHYTTSAYERDSLARVGWRPEGVGWYGVG